jgi:hypothetical protein
MSLLTLSAFPWRADGSAAAVSNPGGRMVLAVPAGNPERLQLRLRSLEAGLLLKQMAGIGKRLDHLGASPLARAACGVIQQVRHSGGLKLRSCVGE